MHYDLIHVADLDDPRLTDYRAVKDRQLAPEFGIDGGRFMAEGEVVFRALVRSPYRTLSVLCTPARLATIQDELAALEPGTPVYVIEAERLRHLIGFDLHRGLMAIGARRALVTVGEVLDAAGPGRPVVVMEDLVNHDNIGGIFRSAAALGAAGVILSHATADPLYRKALRVSVGCVLKMPYARTASVVGVMGQARARGMATLALSPRNDAATLEDVAMQLTHTKQACAVILGAEGPGLTAAAMGAAERLVRIPMRAGVDSLNVGTTAGIVLYRLCRPMDG